MRPDPLLQSHWLTLGVQVLQRGFASGPTASTACSGKGSSRLLGALNCKCVLGMAQVGVREHVGGRLPEGQVGETGLHRVRRGPM